MTTPHKHRDLIVAWADGAVIEARPKNSNQPWAAMDAPGGNSQPGFFVDFEYRIKPEPALSDDATDFLNRFDEAARNWGWQSDQGSRTAAADSEEEYVEAKAKLEAFIAVLEARR